MLRHSLQGPRLILASLLSAALAGVGAGSSQAASRPVTVTLTDSKVVLARSFVPVGVVVFRVVNRGKVAHDFRIAGRRTTAIRPGKRASLRIVFRRRGAYPYVSRRGRRAPIGASLGVYDPCTSPSTTSVNAQMTTGQITLSQTRVPCGRVTFVVTNTDRGAPGVHQLGVELSLLYAVPVRKARIVGPEVLPGQTVRLTVDLPAKGKLYYFCNISEHDEQGEEFGYLTVT